jgi:hypothetical protein
VYDGEIVACRVGGSVGFRILFISSLTCFYDVCSIFFTAGKVLGHKRGVGKL